ncbi:MAG: hypothetical protein WC011_01315 [Candidatus Paceibacterota bacterium]
MKNWFKSSKTVKNPAQAGDTALAFYYEEIAKKLGNNKQGAPHFEYEIHTQERAPLDSSTAQFAVTLWGVSQGFKIIESKNEPSLKKALQKVGFSHDEIVLYSHCIVESGTFASGYQKNDVYRLHYQDYSEIVTGYF